MTCPCGDVMSVDAMSREEAIEKMKGMMTADAVAKHFAEKHVGQPVPPQDQVMMMIEQGMQEAMPMAA